MPAKQKYLSTSIQRIQKISAGILGGLLLTVGIHLAIGSLLEDKSILIITSIYSTFILWVLFMIVAFLFRKGWQAWVIYLSGIILCSLVILINT